MQIEQTYAPALSPRSRRIRPVRPRVPNPVRRESSVLLGMGLAVIAILLLKILPQCVLQDSWLALVAGRDVSQHGIPYHETLTVFSRGQPWVDQQWLSQLLMYLSYQVGGLALVGIANVGLIVSGIGGAILGARRFGASKSSILRVLPLAACNVLLASEVRTQAYAYPLFTATVFLLARDSRQPGRSVYWCLPMLMLWANIHGSASLGAGLIILRGLTLLWVRRRQLVEGAAAWRRPLVLIFGPLLCMCATPYGLSMPSYYRATLFNSSFRQFVTEWQPVTAIPFVAGLLLLLAAITVWSFGRYPSRTTLWERCALLALAAGAVIAVRNVPWFGLAALMLLPVSIDGAVRARTKSSRAHPRANLALAAAAGLGVLVALTVTLSGRLSMVTRRYPQAVLAAVRKQITSNPRLNVYADESYADWLMWKLPAVEGRVAYDARFELLTPPQVKKIVTLKHQSAVDWTQAASGYRLLVLDDTQAHQAVTALSRESGAKVLYRENGVAMILRTKGLSAP